MNTKMSFETEQRIIELLRIDDVKKIINFIGATKLSKILDVSINAIYTAKSRGRFRSDWYFVIKDIARQANIDCPDTLFSFKQIEADEIRKAAKK